MSESQFPRERSFSYVAIELFGPNETFSEIISKLTKELLFLAKQAGSSRELTLSRQNKLLAHSHSRFPFLDKDSSDKARKFAATAQEIIGNFGLNENHARVSVHSGKMVFANEDNPTLG